MCTGVQVPMCRGLASIECHLTFSIFFLLVSTIFPQTIESFVCNSQLTYYFLKLVWDGSSVEPGTHQLSKAGWPMNSRAPSVSPFQEGYIHAPPCPNDYVSSRIRTRLSCSQQALYRASRPPPAPVHIAQNYMRTLREGIKTESVLQNVSTQAGETHSPTSVVTSLLSGVTQALICSNDTQETSTQQDAKLGEWSTPFQLIPGGQKHPTTMQFTNNSSKQSPTHM